MDNCIFCSISKGKDKTKLVFEDKDVVAINDINPKAKIHLLIIPKKHINSIATLNDTDDILVAKMILVAKKLAEDKGISKRGYRLIINIGKHSGQVVDHLHLHLLGGEPLGEMV